MQIVSQTVPDCELPVAALSGCGRGARLMAAAGAAAGAAEDREGEARVCAALEAAGALAWRLLRVPEDYYDRPLQDRAEGILRCDAAHLCKTVLFSDESRRKHCAVVVQYEAKINMPRLQRALGWEGAEPRMTSEEDCAALTGFGFNAVAPFGMTAGKGQVRLVLSESITQLHPPFFWMGGGHVHTKLAMPVDEFCRVAEPLVADVSDARASA